MRAAIASVLLLAGTLAATDAHAVTGPFLLSLENITFSDMATATGVISLNVYGFANGFSVVTTDGPTISGYDYEFGVNSTSGDSTSLTLSVSRPGYTGGFVIELANPLAYATVDPLVLGGASYECIDYCTTTRVITSGDVRVSDPVPEPASIAVFGIGLAALAARRRQRSITIPS